MTASIRVVAPGTLVALALILAMIADSPHADAAFPHAKGSINGVPRENIVEGLCTDSRSSEELFRLVNPTNRRAKIDTNLAPCGGQFDVKPHRRRFVWVRMDFFPNRYDVSIYFNERHIDDDNVLKRSCRI